MSDVIPFPVDQLRSNGGVIYGFLDRDDALRIQVQLEFHELYWTEDLTPNVLWQIPATIRSWEELDGFSATLPVEGHKATMYVGAHETIAKGSILIERVEGSRFHVEVKAELGATAQFDRDPVDAEWIEFTTSHMVEFTSINLDRDKLEHAKSLLDMNAFDVGDDEGTRTRAPDENRVVLWPK